MEGYGNMRPQEDALRKAIRRLSREELEIYAFGAAITVQALQSMFGKDAKVSCSHSVGLTEAESESISTVSRLVQQYVTEETTRRN